MKKYLLSTGLVLMLFRLNAQNGNYIPFPSRMITYVLEASHNSQGNFYIPLRMELQDDTTFNGYTYAKYYTSKNEEGKAWLTNKLTGAIRNDIPNKKVYLYSFDTQTEELLYNFDLHWGDTIFKENNYTFYKSLLPAKKRPSIDTAWVTRIDSVFMPHDGRYHKRFNFNAKCRRNTNEPYYTITSDSVCKRGKENEFFEIKINPLIEGVGPDYTPVSLFRMFEYAWETCMYCRSIDGKTVDPYDPLSAGIPFMNKMYCDPLFVGVEENEKNLSFNLYPNPSNGKFNLKVEDKQLKFLEIKDIFGRQVFASLIEKDETEIDLSTQSTGVYFIQASKKNNTTVRKRIIIQ